MVVASSEFFWCFLGWRIPTFGSAKGEFGYMYTRVGYAEVAGCEIRGESVGEQSMA